ncbi:VWA domain-containing protein [Pseudomonas petrae]|uniref:VWA domain-containing protein n=1 Tax=Pseudomonas petrae TaxID=2912190 RepID=A0ABS9I0E7_9PSED|nr:VWA domain-containing protein [Pseudomonas petrae]MCF7530791.1 VWA domain-containing protein [Pseudomonas petrae]MCF7536464.1 VWA domain-containing protein [Pseudomonas petrae]MCF7541287.1 VWA domain-containing protein [Pseudomonas petrae]MCF7554143.1 VWA domain-containing protein [Pseudomonas petrae]
MIEFLSGLWPHWLRPGWLLLLPALGWLLWRLWNRQKRVGRWQMILPSAFHSALLSGGGGRESKWPWVVLGLGWLLAVLALLGPSWQRVEQNSQRPVDPLVVMLELTPEMLATDSPPTRLEQARRKVLDLLQARSDSQTAIIVYAGSAHTLVPLSDDLATSKNLLDAIKPSIMPEAGQRADLAVRKALDLLEQGDLGQGRLLWIGSSLSDAERQGISAAMTGRDAPPLLMLGVGTAEGAPVTQEKGGFLKDAQGGILVPRLDGPVLKDFADSMGGRYTSLRLDNQDLNDLGLLDGPKSLISQGQKVRLDRWADQGYWLLLPLLLLAGCAGRRGWLLCLPLLLMAVPQPSYAFGFEDLWRTPDQQGQHLLKRHHPAEAARHFEDPQWQGIALYQAGDYAGAVQRFAQGSSAADHYNRGNALARSGELEAAIDAYEQALERQPDFPAALANKALVEHVLEQNKASNQAKADERAKTDENADNAREGNTGQSSSSAQSAPQDADADRSASDQQSSADEQASGAGSDSDEPARASGKPADGQIDGEQKQALEQWLRQIPDEPGELLRRKFWYEQQQHQEKTR